MKRRDVLAASISAATLVPWSKQAFAGTPCPPALLVDGVPGNVACVQGNPQIGTVTQDAVVPEQLALYAPITGPVSENTVAAVQFRLSGDSQWKEASPMWRMTHRACA